MEVAHTGSDPNVIESEGSLAFRIVCAGCFFLCELFCVYATWHTFRVFSYVRRKLPLVIFFLCINMTIMVRVVAILSDIVDSSAFWDVYLGFLPSLFKDTAVFCLAYSMVSELQLMGYERSKSSCLSATLLAAIICHTIYFHIGVTLTFWYGIQWLRMIWTVLVMCVYGIFLFSAWTYMRFLQVVAPAFYLSSKLQFRLLMVFVGLVYIVRLVFNILEQTVTPINEFYQRHLAYIVGLKAALFEVLPCFLLMFFIKSMGSHRHGSTELSTPLTSNSS